MLTRLLTPYYSGGGYLSNVLLLFTRTNRLISNAKSSTPSNKWVSQFLGIDQKRRRFSICGVNKESSLFFLRRHLPVPVERPSLTCPFFIFCNYLSSVEQQQAIKTSAKATNGNSHISTKPPNKATYTYKYISLGPVEYFFSFWAIVVRGWYFEWESWQEGTSIWFPMIWFPCLLFARWSWPS